MKKRRISGLYAVTPETRDGDWLAVQVERALIGGAQVVQYRNKSADLDLRRRQAVRLRDLCRLHEAALIINDDVGLALEMDADGVHLGRDDQSLVEARAMLGAGKLIGISCYDSLGRADEAQRSGADYVAFGSFFPSSVKPQAARASLELLREARLELRLPVVAIGGITPDNGAALVEAGADALAAISALFQVTDTLSAARAFARLFVPSHEPLSIDSGQ
jgi:thiamine-phosphate pyrophosphorylase